MSKVSYNDLMDAGVHFGHLSRKWNPRMAPYIFMKKNGIHIIDLNKTQVKLAEAAAAMKQMAKSGRKIMFVATKKQAKAIVAKHAERAGMPYVTERWLVECLPISPPSVRRFVKWIISINYWPIQIHLISQNANV